MAENNTHLQCADPTSEEQLRRTRPLPVAEFQLITETIRRFRTGYIAEFDAATPDDLPMKSVSQTRRYPEQGHRLALFHDDSRRCSIFSRAPLSRLNTLPKTRRMTFTRSPNITMCAVMPSTGCHAGLQAVAGGTALSCRAGNGKTRSMVLRWRGSRHLWVPDENESKWVRGAGTTSRPSAPSGRKRLRGE